MIKRLDLYVARQFSVIFVALVLGLPLLFIITDVFENLDQHLSRGLSAGAIAYSYLFLLPQFILWSLPIAALVATVFTIGGMTRHHEIVAAKAGGVSFFRLIAPIVLLGGVLSGVALLLGEMVPAANQTRAELIGDRRDYTGSLRTDFVYVTEHGRTLSVRRLDPRVGQMSGVVMERERQDGGGAMHGVADQANWTPERGWRLEHGYIRFLTGEDAESTFEFTSLDVPDLTETPQELLAEPRDADEMRYGELSRVISAIERSGGDSREMRTERIQKIAVPMAVLVIVLFGAPLATSSKRGGAAYGIGVSLAVTMAYLLLFRVGSAMGASGTLPPIAAGWLPNLLFLGAGLFLLTRVRT